MIFQILAILGKIKVSWLIPEWNILSLVFYCVVVYPVAYMLVARLFMAPIWDIISLVWRIGKWVAGIYDKIGITPDSIPKEESATSSPSGFWWGLMVSMAEHIKEFGNKPA